VEPGVIAVKMHANDYGEANAFARTTELTSRMARLSSELEGAAATRPG
jgi:hypothetical protein